MDKSLSKIKDSVFAKRPILKEIVGTYGHLTLAEYARQWQLPSKKADEAFLQIIRQEAKNIFGQEIADCLFNQLSKKPLVSTIDHLGIWNHPFFVNSDLIYSLNFSPEDLVPILATQSVSLNNVTSWSASLLWHEGGNLRRASFLPDKIKQLPVISAPAISQKDIEHFNKSTQGRFKNVVSALAIDATDANFSLQACKTSLNFWQAVFPSAPKAICLPLETLVIKYLQKVFQNKDHVLSRLVLSGQGQDLWKKYFASEQTFMFWGIDGHGRRHGLAELHNINLLMSQGKIYPSSPLCFAALLYAGLACAGGFNQTTRLTLCKEKLINLFNELGATEAAESLKQIPTKNFAESSLAWLNGFAPSGLDLFLTGKDCYGDYLKLAQKLTLEKSFELALPEIYSVVAAKS